MANVVKYSALGIPFGMSYPLTFGPNTKTFGQVMDYGKPIKHMPLITSIFYMNTTDAPTILEDGTEIECRANRLVSFPYDTYHAGVLCTDQQYRIVINLNYFKEIEY